MGECYGVEGRGERGVENECRRKRRIVIEVERITRNREDFSKSTNHFFPSRLFDYASLITKVREIIVKQNDRKEGRREEEEMEEEEDEEDFDGGREGKWSQGLGE